MDGRKRRLWSSPITRKALLVKLADAGYGKAELNTIQSLIDAERTWLLEAAGYETEVDEFVGSTVTPHNLLWRSRLVGETGLGVREGELRREVGIIAFPQTAHGQPTTLGQGDLRGEVRT